MINTLERISREVANEYTGYGDSVNVFSEIEFAEGNSKGTWIQVLRYGEWDHPVYGKVKVDNNTFSRLVQHFNEGVRGIDIAVDTEHKEDKGASGWIKKLDPRPTGLWAFVEWTKKGWSLIKDKVYRYISAEFSPAYEDPETKQSFKDVLVAVTLTNRPFIKRMAPVLLSEPGLRDQLLADYMFVSPMDTDNYESDESESESYRFGCKCDSEEGEDEGTPEKGSRDPVRTLKMKHKNKKGGKTVRQFDDIGEYESGLDIDTEEFEEVMSESLFDDDDTQEYDEYDDDDEYYDEDTQEYDEDEDELDGQYYDVPEGAYAFSEGRQMIDHEARNAVIALSEQVQIEQEKNLRLQETLKLTAVEEEVATWVENNGVGKIFPAQAELAVRLLMELPNREANMLRAFVESLPNSVEYGERGINTIETDQGGYSLQERAREIYDHYQTTNTPIKMGEAVKMAYKELNQ